MKERHKVGRETFPQLEFKACKSNSQGRNSGPKVDYSQVTKRK